MSVNMLGQILLLTALFVILFAFIFALCWILIYGIESLTKKIFRDKKKYPFFFDFINKIKTSLSFLTSCFSFLKTFLPLLFSFLFSVFSVVQAVTSFTTPEIYLAKGNKEINGDLVAPATLEIKVRFPLCEIYYTTDGTDPEDSLTKTQYDKKRKLVLNAGEGGTVCSKSKFLFIWSEKGERSQRVFDENTSESYIELQHISFQESEKTIAVGQDTRLNLLLTPDNATEKQFSWESSNPSIASVQGEGGSCSVTGHSGGIVNITATSVYDNKIRADISVEVVSASGQSQSVAPPPPKEVSSKQMPAVKGESFKNAQKILSNAGIQYVINWEHSESEKWGLVMRQSVQQGARLDPGTEVTLTVSMGTAGKYIKKEEYPAYSDEDHFLIENVAKYKLATKEEMTQDSDSHSPGSIPGWNYLRTDEIWGPWVDWTGTNPPKGDNLDVKEEVTTTQTLVGYNVSYYMTRWPGNINRQYLSYSPEGYDPDFGIHHYTGYVSKEAYDNAPRLNPGEYYYGDDGQGFNADSTVAIIGQFGEPWFPTPWFVSGEVYEDIPTVKYSTRTRKYTHYYERWVEGNWSNWVSTDDIPAETKDQKVETEIGYWVEGVPD